MSYQSMAQTQRNAQAMTSLQIVTDVMLVLSSMGANVAALPAST
jgi:hypothetical protein